MKIKQRSLLILSLVAITFLFLSPTFAAKKVASAEKSKRPFSLIVMDPLAAPLSCPCVKGYAQRKYEKLGEFLEKTLGRKVQVTFSDSLAKAIEGDANGYADLIIGKDSVIRADAKSLKLKVRAIASLSDLKGKTTQTGLIVVPAKDPAKEAKDLNGYRILLGPSECDEKHFAALNILKEANVKLPAKLETSAACSDGACKILEFGKDVRAAAVISSYAKPLLQGCGTINKGDLRVIAETKPVPFIVAFINKDLPATQRKQIKSNLMKVGENPELCIALESLFGFVPVKKQKEKQKNANRIKKK